MTLRVGILGAARVAVYAVIAAARNISGVTVQAVAARDIGRARAYADTHAIPKAYPDYQALIDGDDVDAVYVALRRIFTPAGRSPRWLRASRCSAKNHLRLPWPMPKRWWQQKRRIADC